MSDIGHIQSGYRSADVGPDSASRSVRSNRQPGREAQSLRRDVDRVELSSSRPPRRDDSEIRADLVIRVREEIVRGVYETPEKLSTALDAMVREVDRPSSVDTNA